MRKLRLFGVAGLTLAAFAIPASTASADTFIYRCPDHFQPVPTQALPPGEFEDKDNNNNFIVCAKGPQGSNQHFNVKDDHGQTVSPSEWSTTPTVYGIWVVENILPLWVDYALDPAPTEVRDDVDVLTGQ
jgi:hypothetical protein